MSFQARFLFPKISLNKSNVSKKLRGKTILITGATFGIGEALTRHLFNYDVQLILVARTSEKLFSLKEESRALEARVTTITCDLYSEASIKQLCDELKSVRIDVFVSNAGKSIMRSLAESADRIHDYNRTIAVNYLAPVQIISTMAESFRLANTHIVNVSSYNVLMKTPPDWAAYVSSKKAMHSWIESNTAPLACMNITVSNIYFPLVESRMKAANKNYDRTPAIGMETAVAILVKGMLSRNYTYKPWWHIPFQVLLFLGDPLWNWYWYRHVRQRK